MLNEIKNIDDLIDGQHYAYVWLSTDCGFRNKWLEYVRVVRTDKTTKSGELVVCSNGRRKFSSLRWFGPLPSNISEIDG
jgi:hypothetical protein